MNDCKVFVGLDYHKNSVQVCVVNQRGDVLLNRRCRNGWPSIVKVVNGQGIVSRVAIESCSGAVVDGNCTSLHENWRRPLLR